MNIKTVGARIIGVTAGIAAIVSAIHVPTAPHAALPLEARPPMFALARAQAAVFGPRVAWLDVTDPAQARALLAIARHFDNVLGYPVVAYDDNDAAMPARFWTLHHTLPIPHPTQAGRWAMPLDAPARAEILLMRARCTALLDAGSLPDGAAVPAYCAPLAALSTPGAAHDATWTPNDAGPDRTWDAGAALLPDDDYQGVTP